MQRECYIPEPVRVPLTPGLSDFNVPEEFSEVVSVLKSATNQSLFQWKEFPVNLPSSVLNVSRAPLSSIFTAPEFDECEMLSKDSHGNSKPLNRHQLIQLRRTAEFDVDSLNFIGEVHTWRISSFFLKGTDNIRKTLLEDLQGAMAHLVIHAHDRIVSKQFSIFSALCAGYRDCFIRLLDLLFGWPYVNHGDVDRKLMEERLRFITCELSVKSSQRKRVMDFWDTYEQFMTVSRDTPIDHLESKQPPYRFVTPARIPIDLRLHNSLLLDRCLAIIHELRVPVRSGWFQDFKEQAISRFREEGKSIPEIKRLVRQDALREYASRLFDAMRHNDALQNISPGIAEPLVQQATFSLILAEAKDAFVHAWMAHQQAAEHQLRRKHPVLYHIEEWRSRKLLRMQQQYLETHKFDVHEYVLSKCTSAGLEQHAFFISRDLLFLRDRERLLREQLEKSFSFPDTQFIFRVPAQLLRHWRVYRKHISHIIHYELVDTILLSRRPSSNDPILPVKRSIKRVTASATAASGVGRPSRDTSFDANYPRKPPTTEQELGPQDFEVHATASPEHAFRQSEVPLVDLQHLEEANLITQPLLDGTNADAQRAQQPEYVVQSSLIYKASTRYFMWRWLAFFVCTYSWFLRAGQLLFITIPFRSALSYTALFKPSPIYLKLEIDQATGYLFYNKTFYQDTVISRIRRLWCDIRASRAAFDATPSKGMLDKAAARPLHRIWSYVFRGFLASVLLLLFWPPVCLLVSTLSLITGLTLPIMVPFVSLTTHLLGLVFWDAYKPTSCTNRLLPVFELIFIHFLIRFVLHFCLALLVSVVVCPLLSIVKFFWAIVRFCSRYIWDSLVFHLILRRLARIPSREDFMVKRVSGPGTAANHFYQARPIDILVILMGQLELLELRLWRRQMESLADQPLDAYKKLAQSLSWLSLVPQMDGELYGGLCRQTKAWRAEISTKLAERNHGLQLDLKPNQSRRIKLSDRDLRLALRMGAELTECFYRNRIAPRLQMLSQNALTWWSNFALANDDFLGLCTNLLGQTFGEQLFTCIMETDTVFPIQVREPGLTRQFQEYLIEMVTQRVSNRSLDQMNAAVPSNHLMDVNPKTRLTTDRETEEDVLSMTSEANISTSDIFSQRCTVIPASPSKRRAILEGKSSGSALEIESSFNAGSERAVSFVFPEHSHYTQQRPVPDPIAFIHIDLPLFPLSTFAPSTSRHLPLPLRSSPKQSTVSHLPCCPDPGYIEQSCACCICATKATLERHNHAKLVARWGQLTEYACNKNAIEQACAEHTREDLIYPVCSGLTTLLAHEERDLRRQLTTWEIPDIQTGRRVKISSPRQRLLNDWPLESPSRCQCRELQTRPATRSSLLEVLFGASCLSRAQFRRSPVANVVEHLGRVYHPAIITLLMHARDREHNPLDFTHPAVQASINIITTPQKEFNLLTRLKQQQQQFTTASPSSNYPAHLAVSVGSELAHDPAVVLSERVHSPNPRSELGSVKQVRRKQVLSECFAKDTSSPNESNQRPHSVWTENVHGIVETSTKAQLNSSPNTNLPTTSAVRTLHQADEATTGAIHSRDQLNQHMLFGWDDTNALIAGYWSGMETPGYDVNCPDYSAGTPTMSLYGTEDAATTEDLDDTEDSVSLSSMNHCEYMENFLTQNASHEQNNRNLFVIDRPQHLPLAVPELLTTSATTAGSSEPNSLLDTDADQDYLKSHTTLAGVDSISNAPSSTVLASGAPSIAVTPDSSEIPLHSNSRNSLANTVAGSSTTGLGTPDLLAGMPTSGLQSCSPQSTESDKPLELVDDSRLSPAANGETTTTHMEGTVEQMQEEDEVEEGEDTLKAVVIV